MGSKIKGIRYVSYKNRLRYKISSFVIMRTNLIPSNSLIHAKGGMASDGSSPFPLTDHPAYWSVRRRDSKGIQSWYNQ